MADGFEVWILNYKEFRQWGIVEQGFACNVDFFLLVTGF